MLEGDGTKGIRWLPSYQLGQLGKWYYHFDTTGGRKSFKGTMLSSLWLMLNLKDIWVNPFSKLTVIGTDWPGQGILWNGGDWSYLEWNHWRKLCGLRAKDRCGEHWVEEVRDEWRVTKKNQKKRQEVPGKLGKRSFLGAKGEENFKGQRTANRVKCYGEFKWNKNQKVTPSSDNM